MSRERLEAAIVTSPSPTGRGCQRRRLNSIEDYLNINGPHLTARQAARRRGRSMRTIERYKAVLRQVTP